MFFDMRYLFVGDNNKTKVAETILAALSAMGVTIFWGLTSSCTIASINKQYRKRVQYKQFS